MCYSVVLLSVSISKKAGSEKIKTMTLRWTLTSNFERWNLLRDGNRHLKREACDSFSLSLSLSLWCLSFSWKRVWNREEFQGKDRKSREDGNVTFKLIFSFERKRFLKTPCNDFLPFILGFNPWFIFSETSMEREMLMIPWCFEGHRFSISMNHAKKSWCLNFGSVYFWFFSTDFHFSCYEKWAALLTTLLFSLTFAGILTPIGNKDSRRKLLSRETVIEKTVFYAKNQTCKMLTWSASF